MWKFLSRGHGETEGFSNGSLAEFKGNPLQALAREICQNSLDAADGSGKPVVVEFQKYYMNISDFPGMDSMNDVISACEKFWHKKADVNTNTFLRQARRCLDDKSGKFTVLRISDYNTTGVSGAFSDEDITPWGSLVKGNAFSVKADTKNAAGSYGIGKAAPFVCSYFQTIFYRSYDMDDVQASLGVARLMAHESIEAVPEGEDPVRRSVGYFGSDSAGKPASGFKELDKLNVRSSQGTDIFIPGFTSATTDDTWVKEVLREIVDNFLYSIYIGKLEIHIGSRTLNKANLGSMLDFIGSKDASMFYNVIRDNPNVTEVIKPFHNLGQLRLRLLYGPELNKKVLVVRNSGMKIARISSLPRQIQYTGFLELQGDDLNDYFRRMENPSHNAWEPKRHPEPTNARKYKEEVETWVIETISQKLLEMCGDETLINTGDCFNFSENTGSLSEGAKKEKITDETDKVETEAYIPATHSGVKLSIRDEGRTSSSKKVAGRDDPDGEDIGHRHRSGKKPGGQPKGRNVTIDPTGPDSVNVGEGGKSRVVPVSARIISRADGTKRLVFEADENITLGRLEIVTKGENGKSLKLKVQDAQGTNVTSESGNIVIRNIPAHEKQSCEFTLSDKGNYALGVKAYGN